ncbi:putative helitron helicase-like domain-containing protein [Helianthus annuus]|nr:putative helitron helicase-like domain-containing protein [Helianthus annuus]
MVSSSISFANLFLIFSGVGVSRFFECVSSSPMQHPRLKRRRRASSTDDVPSSSDASFPAGDTTHRQTAYRAAIARSRVQRAVPGHWNMFQPVSVQQLDRSTPVEYLDLGSCTEVCEHCQALFWYDERLVSSPVILGPKYNKCCKGGRVVLPYPIQPPDLLKLLYADSHFMSNIRAYNAMFSMTSFGATIDEDINTGGGPYVFKVAGQVSHWLGSLCPPPGDKPRFLQMYIFDSENEVENRLRFFTNNGSGQLNPEIVSALSLMLSDVNGYVKLFKSAREICLQSSVPNFVIKLFSRVADRRYDAPAPHMLGAIIREGNMGAADYDIIVKSRENTPQRVSKLHSSYMPLQYPILFPTGEKGWSPELHMLDVTTTDDDALPVEERNLTPIMYYSYQIHDRRDTYTHLLRSGRLFQQYLVDAYICVEHCRLEYIRKNQDEFRCEFLDGVQDAISRGDVDARNVGKRVILPASFTGGPRYMYKHYQDALAICRVYGNPQYFITFTCNVRWPEISREIQRVGVSSAQDRPDIIARVFQLKVRYFIKYLRNAKPFGDVTADLYTIEFQKRGLPHCHTLLWVSDTYTVRTPADVNRYISAELPDRDADPMLYRIVTESMLHGPCGIARMTSPCMEDGVCTKNFPKPYETVTRFDSAGYVHYMRASNCEPFLKNGIPLDNGYVVPYNRNLLLHFDAHINVEYCGWSMLIKYLFKYIAKGVDRIRFALTSDRDTSSNEVINEVPVVDEIQNFMDARFICPHEATWRILAFPIHHRNPPVQVLAVHLEGKQNLTFKQSQRLNDITNNPNTGKTTLTEWLSSNTSEMLGGSTSSVGGLNLRYIDYLSKFRWDLTKKMWVARKSRRTPTVGRLAYVHPSCGELFYLRILLTYQCGCCSFEDIRKVSGTVMPTYREACEKLGLIGDDKEWETTISEAAEWASGPELRSLFMYLLMYCDVSNPAKLWEQNWRCMSDDINHRLQQPGSSSSSFVNTDDLQQYVLFEMQVLLNSNSSPQSLTEFGLPALDPTVISALQNSLLLEEKTMISARYKKNTTCFIQGSIMNNCISTT